MKFIQQVRVPIARVRVSLLPCDCLWCACGSSAVGHATTNESSGAKGQSNDVFPQFAMTMLFVAAVAMAFASPMRMSPVQRHARTAVVMRKKESWARRVPASTPLGPGSVLCAAAGSFDHYFMDSLVLVVEHSTELGTKGVLLNHETPFNVGDMTSGLGDLLGENPMFLGGDTGSDTMIMLHGMPLLEGSRRLRPDSPDDVICVGGVKAATEMVDAGQLRGTRPLRQTLILLPRIAEHPLCFLSHSRSQPRSSNSSTRQWSGFRARSKSSAPTPSSSTYPSRTISSLVSAAHVSCGRRSRS